MWQQANQCNVGKHTFRGPAIGKVGHFDSWLSGRLSGFKLGGSSQGRESTRGGRQYGPRRGEWQSGAASISQSPPRSAVPRLSRA
eukprot:6190796-Pleurochrysis_carterae.AAC.1